ncbi:hypothetical protein KEM52_006318 [Ascosphaera acerosa]|nr:hypothetical protein KEM52_006318 [Ascosphaera acerosa]
MARDEAAASDSEAEKQNLAILVDAFDPEQSARYDLFKRAKLNKAMLRKIVNQTLSQSVPPNVITTIGGYTKVFIGELVERARTVQEQWAEIEDRHAREEILRQRQAERRQRRRRQQRGEKDREPEETDADVKMAADDSSSPAGAATRAESPSQPPPPDAANSDAAMPDPSPPQTHDDAADGDRPTTAASSEHGPHDTHAAPASDTEMASTSEAEAEAEAPPQDTPVADHELPPNPHRGQLLPQHLREALRQYKRDHEGGGVGFAGLSLRSLGVQGSGAWGQNGGGKRLFR